MSIKKSFFRVYIFIHGQYFEKRLYGKDFPCFIIIRNNCLLPMNLENSFLKKSASNGQDTSP